MTSYKASGRYSIAGLFGFWIGALLGGILLSAGYVYLLGLVSNLLLRVLVVVGYDVANFGMAHLAGEKNKNSEYTGSAIFIDRIITASLL